MKIFQYTQLDEEHKVLFDALKQLAQDPTNEDILNYNRDVFRDHFDYEESQFKVCGEPCSADDHKNKHDYFFKTLTWVKVPISQTYIDFGTNW
jgi:hemerythrin